MYNIFFIGKLKKNIYLFLISHENIFKKEEFSFHFQQNWYKYSEEFLPVATSIREIPSKKPTQQLDERRIIKIQIPPRYTIWEASWRMPRKRRTLLAMFLLQLLLQLKKTDIKAELWHKRWQGRRGRRSIPKVSMRLA